MKKSYVLIFLVSSLSPYFVNPQDFSSSDPDSNQNGYNDNNNKNSENFRTSKDFMFITHNRKLGLPLGTTLSVTPSITIPMLRDGRPRKLQADFSASAIMYITFDDLEMSGAGDIPYNQSPFFPFNNGNGNTKLPQRQRPNQLPIPNNRVPRSIMSLPSPENIHGGERAIIMPTVEGLLSNFGFEGRACLLRAICEVHEFPLKNGYGLFGEMITLLFSVSQSAYAESHMPEYLKAEMVGKSGDCSRYHKKCPKSIFKWEPKAKNKFKGP